MNGIGWTVQPGTHVMVEYASFPKECIVVGPGPFDYELIVEHLKTWKRFTVHRDSVLYVTKEAAV